MIAESLKNGESIRTGNRLNRAPVQQITDAKYPRDYRCTVAATPRVARSLGTRATRGVAAIGIMLDRLSVGTRTSVDRRPHRLIGFAHRVARASDREHALERHRRPFARVRV